MDKKEYHVLVVAMSTFNNWVEGTCCTPDGSFISKYAGQLEVIPLWLMKTLKEKITHIIILETKECKNEKLIERKLKSLKGGETELAPEMNKLQNFLPGYSPVCELTHTQFFKERIIRFASEFNRGCVPEFIETEIDENDMEPGFNNLITEIRRLYSSCHPSCGGLNGDAGDWKLWLDVHGGFRTISMGFFSLIQDLFVPTIDSDPTYEEAIKTIPINAVCSVKHDSFSNQTIVYPLTDYYQRLISDKLKKYANYGQYILKSLEPDEGTPYAFISYKHGDCVKERYALMGYLKKINIRYWYDDGIHLQSGWEQTLEEKNKDCDIFIALLTENYFKSAQCAKELFEAINNNKELLFISLDGSGLDESKEPYTAGLEFEIKKQKFRIEAEELKKVILDKQGINLRDSSTPYINDEFTIQERLEERIKDSGLSEIFNLAKQ